jgi:hypothetical protein
MAVKQKSQSSAAFLGVLKFSKNVVDGCCIPTTIQDLRRQDDITRKAIFERHSFESAVKSIPPVKDRTLNPQEGAS